MSVKAEIVTAACAVGCAFCIGYVMQSGEVAELRYGSGSFASASVTSDILKPVRPVKVHDATVVGAAGLLDVEQIKLASAGIAGSGHGNHISDQFQSDADVMSDAQIADDIVYEVACDVTARAISTEDEMVTLTVDAPCFGDEEISVSHAQLDLSERLSPDGHLELILPAPQTDSHINVSFENGERITALLRM